MGKNNTLQTGVDKLVELVKAKKRISVAEASKTLGVSPMLIKQWAELLEDGGVVSMDYLFTMPYIVEKNTAEKEHKLDLNHYQKQKDLFISRAESIQKNLDKEGLTIRKLKKEFDELKKEIGPELSNFTSDLSSFGNIKSMEKGVLDEMKNEQSSYLESIAHLKLQLKDEKIAFSKLLRELLDTNEHLDEEMVKFSHFSNKQSMLKKNLIAINKDMKSLNRKIGGEKHIIEGLISKKDVLTPKIMGIAKDIKKKNSSLKKLIKQAGSFEERISKQEKTLERKFHRLSRRLNGDLFKSKATSKRFIDFIKKKHQLESLLTQLSKEKESLKKDLAQLVKDADIIKKKSGSKKRADVKQLHEHMKRIDSKRNWFKSQLRNLAKLLK